MPTYEHLCNACEYEWEEFYSIVKDPPTLCPECKMDGKVKRLISGGSGRGIVILTGHDLSAHCKAEGRKIARQAMKDENLKANLIGEEKYHNQLLQTSQITNELVKIGENAPTKKQQKKKGVIRRVDKK
ncbi:hypothetical protein LCGC14_0427080 [marine sediment metagenome]|uniref:Putative regulatory protein FmdB zinc ribbon domain-containing protein n=1 Tax=marine sediment metagenome TaxID=412755 RepID=A0A0F9VBA2_9ZZZZ